MINASEMIGKRFGFLTVVADCGMRIVHGKSRRVWQCVCDCGDTLPVEMGKLKTGMTVSCPKRHSIATHGHSRNYNLSPSLRSYNSMIGRCYHPSNAGYEHYKKRGIKVCDRWHHGENGKSGFQCFLEDMGERADKSLTIERVNNDGNYEPGNCIWATRKEQGNNRITNRKFEWEGQIRSIEELAVMANQTWECMRHRLLRAGWPIDKAMTIKEGKRGRRGMHY